MQYLNLVMSPARQRALTPLHSCIGTIRKAMLPVLAKDADHLRQYHAIEACIDDESLIIRHRGREAETTDFDVRACKYNH